MLPAGVELHWAIVVTPMSSPAAALTVTVPDTVASAAGLVIDTVGAAVLSAVTVALALAELPASS